MANLKEIKNRIKSIESTEKITRAMKMVAAAKVKKAENTVKASRPFTQELNTMFKRLLKAADRAQESLLHVDSASENYPELLQVREVKTVGLLVITSNKGLAGAYNANVIRKTIKIIEDYSAQGIRVILFIVGQKGILPIKRKAGALNFEIAKTYLNIANNPSGVGAKVITEDLAEFFVDDRIDKIEIVTTRFKNTMSYFTETWDVMPLQDFDDNNGLDGFELEPVMEFLPNINTVLEKIVPLYISNIVYQALLEAQASELASRMTAMSAASSNARDMISDLSIQYNRSRQDAITQEIVEVVSGASAQAK